MGLNLRNKIDRNLGFSPKRSLNVGDVVTVLYENRGGFWKARKFTGICIGRSLKGGNERYTLRNVINGVGVEFSFYIHSNSILRIEKLPVQKLKKVRRSALYYLRARSQNESRIKVV